jgi:ABC-2 type transport system permease protein
MPEWLQIMPRLSPTTHFFNSAPAILYRGAGLESICPELVSAAVIGAVFFATAPGRFRRMIAVMQSHTCMTYMRERPRA